MNKKLFQFRYCLLVLFIISLYSTINAEAVEIPSNPDSLFKAGVNYYKNGNYKKAYDTFQVAVFDDDKLIYLPYALFMRGQLLYEMGENRRSVAVLKEFLRISPTDKLRAECQYLLGNNYYKMNLYNQALREYLNVFLYKKQSLLSAKAGKNALNLFSEDLTIKDLTHIKNEFVNPDIINIIDLKITLKYAKSGELNLAKRLIDRILKSEREKFYYNQALKIDWYIDGLKAQGIIIGLILPINGKSGDIGKGIYEGAELAREEYNKENERTVNFLVEDSKNDPIEGIFAFEKLIKNKPVVGLLGPVDKDVCTAVALEANYNKIPVIFPMTSDRKFSFLGEYVFQVNSDYFKHIKSIAEYAMKNLDLKTFAILAPIRQDGQKKDEYFKQVIDGNGGTIVSDQGYFPGTLDLTRQFQEIRRQGFKMMFFDSLQVMSDSIEISILDEGKIRELESEFFEKKKLELSEKRNTNVRVDSLDIPITSIDGLFLPLEKEDVNIIVSQFPFFNLVTQVIGGKNWYNPTVSESNINYLNNMIFTSDYFIEESNVDFLEFINKFRFKFGRTPGFAEVYGYDCVSLFLKAIEKGVSTREEIRDELTRLDNFQGIKGKISFDKDFRTNKFVKVLKYVNGRIIELK